MDWVQDIDWSALAGPVGLAAVVATAVATVTSTAVTLWWRRQDRPEADWALSNGYARRSEARYGGQRSDPVEYTAVLSNAGDGVAFRVTVEGDSCKAGLSEPGPGSPVTSRRAYDVVPAMRPGDEIRLWVQADDDSWTAARITLEWTQSPTRKGKRRRVTFLLKDLATLPEWKQE